MNRVIIGAVTVIVFVGIIALAARALSAVNVAGLFKPPVPKTGTLTLPQASPVASAATASFSPIPVASSSPVANASTSPFLRTATNPSPSVLPVSGGGTLPATGL